MRVFLQRLGHLSAETLNGTAVGGIGRWFGWLGVEALTKVGLKARRHRGHVVRISGIDLVAGRARCASAAATAGPFTPRTADLNGFRRPTACCRTSTASPRALQQTNVGAVKCVPLPNLRLTFVVAEDGYRVL
jgi:hypothetical protein